MLTPHICEQARLARDPRFDGLFFILVKSTKIFCRNTCKVKLPLEKNVSYSTSAQQALNQGYRPCLRCRPDSAPNSYAWLGVNTTLNRAVKLLTQRLDANIANIAASLGISTRYLNKLFDEHMQISPKRYRIYQQVLMAKQLLQQTSLSVEKVAESVGFTSARQLQLHVKTHLRLTPSQLRKAPTQQPQDATTNDTAGFLEDINILLAYRPPYNWPQVRDFFAKRQIHGNECVAQNSVSKILAIKVGYNHSDGNTAYVAVRVTISYAPLQNGFTLSFNAQYSKYTLAIIGVVRRMLDLDASPQLIEQALANAGLPVDNIVEGLRIPGVASEFEAGCRAILGQQVSVAAAVNKVNHLHAHFAQQKYAQLSQSIVNHQNGGAESLAFAFPSPHEVASSDLLFLKIPAARRQTLIALAAFYARKEDQEYIEDDNAISAVAPASSTKPLPVNMRKTVTKVDDEKDAALIDIKGIGPWTVSYIELRAIGDSDIWLNTDLVIKQQVAKFNENKHAINAELAAPWRSYLTLNLWSLA